MLMVSNFTLNVSFVLTCTPVTTYADLIDEGILLSKATLRHHQLVDTSAALQQACKEAKKQQPDTSDTRYQGT